MVTLARPPTRSSLKITNRSFRYAASCLWNELPTDLRKPRQTQSPSLLPPITFGSSSSSKSLLHFHLLSLFQSFILNLRLGSSANTFHHSPFSYLSDWFYGLSDHVTFLFCSTVDLFAWCVRLSHAFSRFSNELKINAFSFNFTSLHFIDWLIKLIDWLIDWFIHSFIHLSFIYLFIHLFIHALLVLFILIRQQGSNINKKNIKNKHTY